MADITTNLGTPINTVKNAIPSSPEEVSGIDLFARAGSRAIEAAEEFARGQRIYENRQEAKAAKLAQSEKDEANKAGAIIAELAKSSPGIAPGDEIDGGGLANTFVGINDYGIQLATLREAKAQGRISQTAYEARVFQVESGIRAKYGDDVFLAYREQLRKNSGDKAVLSGFNKDVDKDDAEFKQYLNAEKNAYEVAVSMGLSEDTYPGGRQAMIRFGQNKLKADAVFDQAVKELEFNSKRLDLDEKERAFREDQLKKEILSAFQDDYLNQIDAAFQVAFATIPAGLSDEGSAEYLLNVLPTFRAGKESWLLESRRMLESRGFKGSEIEDIIGPRDRAIEAMFKAIEEAPNTAKKALELLQNRMGLNAAQSMPVYTTLAALFGKPGAVAILDKANPQFLSEFIKEINTNMGQLDQNTSRFAHFGRMSMVLNGQLDRLNLPPDQAKQILKNIIQIVPSVANTIANDKGEIDPVTLTTTKNGIGEISLAATRASPSTGLEDLKAIIPGLASPDILRVFKAGLNSSDAASWRELAVANKVGTAQVLQILLTGDEGGLIRYNKGLGRFESTYKERPETSVGFGKAINKWNKYVVGTPANVQERVRLANAMLDHLQQFDTLLPEQKIGTSKEARDFYATGDLPRSLRGDKEGARADVVKAVSDLVRVFEQGPRVLGESTRRRTESRGKGLTIERANNPGALKDGSFAKSQPGYQGSDGGFAVFETPEQGIKAQENLLKSQYLSKGANTVSKIVNKYAPVGAENSQESVRNYINYVSRRLGVSPSDEIPEEMIPRLASAMREFETGKRS